MTKVFSSLPRNTAQPLAVGIRPLMETSTMSAGMAARCAVTGQSASRAEASETVERDTPGPGLREHGGLVEHDDLAGFQRGGAEAGLVHGLQRAQAEDGHIEAEILPGLHCFDKEGLVGLEFPGAAEHVVRALEGLDGEHGALADGAALADVEPGDLAGDVDAVLQVFLIDAQLAGHRAGRAQLLAPSAP